MRSWVLKGLSSSQHQCVGLLGKTLNLVPYSIQELIFKKNYQVPEGSGQGNLRNPYDLLKKGHECEPITRQET